MKKQNKVSDFFKKFYKNLFIEPLKCPIMDVQYNLEKNYISCTDWYGRNISPFTGEYTPELWEEIKKWSKLDNTFPYTRINIWAGWDKKHLAYCEPIHNYIKNEALLKTGQGFHYGSGKKYPEMRTIYEIKQEKKILYLDMDGVIADFDKAIKKFNPKLHTSKFETTRDEVDVICESNPDIFHTLPPIEGAIDAVKELFELYHVYFLSTPMWNVPMSFAGKRIWLEDHFGNHAEKRLILTHRKDLNIGHILVDDTLRNGVDGFKGKHIHFGTDEFPNWEITLKHLKSIA